MIDLTKVNGILKATQQLADLQRQVNASQNTQAANASQGTQQGDPATSQMFAQLGQLLNTASTQQPAQQTDLQKQAALLSAKVKALMSNADNLENELNLSPTPDQVNVEELFSQFKEIMESLEKDLRALQKKVQEKKEANEMKLEQKPTAMKVGEKAGDLSFNTTMSIQ